MPNVAGIAARVFGTTASLIADVVEVLLLAVFFLGAGSGWRERIGEAVGSPGARRTAIAVARETQAVVARYVLATALINVGQGIVVGLAMWIVGMPTPLLWGLLTFFAEFVPYLGGAVMVGLLALVGLASAEGPVRALLAPGLYLAITTLQNNVVSPIVYGAGLRLNPIAILVAVLFWWSVWGVAGAFLAVPFLAALNVLARHVERLAPVAVFLRE